MKSNEGGELHKKQLFEVSSFLFLIVPSMVLSFFAIKQGSLSFILSAISIILRDMALVALIFFFLWRNGEPLKCIGWTFTNSWKDIILGLVLFVPTTIGSRLLDSALRAAGFSSPQTPQPSFLAASGTAEFLLASVLVVVVALAEEIIFRGYLIRRFDAIAGSSAAAVLLSSAVFSLGHGYEGTAGVITVGIMGLIFALIYCWRRSLVAPIVMHFLQDFAGIVLLPFVKTR